MHFLRVFGVTLVENASFMPTSTATPTTRRPDRQAVRSPAARHRLTTATATHAGQIRAFNDDSLALDAAAGAFVLADGMGGHNAGDVAAEIATRIVLESLSRSASGHASAAERLRNAVRDANDAIRRAERKDSARTGMGTTLAVTLFGESRVAIGHVGDSRIYRLRGGRLKLLTRDHSVLQEQAATGLLDRESARVSQNRSLVTRALGAGYDATPEVSEVDFLPGDIFLLCSDGLNDMVDDADIELALAELGCNLDMTAQVLVELANDNGGQDNISVLLVRVDGEAESGNGWRQRMFGWLRG
jgi:serine/threonine protein phosphatase PrpC